MNEKQTNAKIVEKKLIKYAKADIDKVYFDFDTRESGLNQIEADERLEQARKKYN